MIRCHLHQLCVCFGLTVQVNIYANQDGLRPVGNPPLAGEQVRLIIWFVSLINNNYIRLESIMGSLWQRLIYKVKGKV